MKFHLNPSDTGEISWFNLPFCTFAVAFQEITAPGHFDEAAEREGRRGDFMCVPGDYFWSSVSKRSFYDPHGNVIQPDIFPQKVCSHRLHCDNVRGIAACPDTKGSHICTDVDDPIMGGQVIEPVFRNLKDLAKMGLMQDKSDVIR